MEAEKKRVSARTAGKRGALIGGIIVAIIMGIVGTVEMDSVVGWLFGTLLAGLGGGVYGFGYAFGWRLMLSWAAGALHYSGHVLDAGFIWWICTGKGGGILRGLLFTMFILSCAIGFAWIPGVFKGIKTIRAEKKEEIAAGISQTGTKAVSEKKQMFARPKKAKDVQTQSIEQTKSNAMTEMQMPVQAEPAKASFMDCFGGEFYGASFNMQDIRQLAIGRNPQLCRVILNESGISRIHCMVQYRADGMYVQDMSTNGTYLLNGTRLPKGTFVPVRPGDGIRLGKNGPEFRFR